MPIEFITSNPAIDEFDRQQKLRREQVMDAARLRIMGNQATDMEVLRPSRLRTAEAGATSAETEAGVGQQTAPIRVEGAGVGLQRAKTDLGSEEVEAGVRRSTAPMRVERTQVDLGSAKTEAGVQSETAPTRVAAAKTGLRRANADAVNTELQTLYKSLEALNAGDVEGAKEIARRGGQELPEAAITDSQWRGQVTAIAKRAQELFPNRPRDQQTYIETQIEELRKLKDAGQLRVESRYKMPPGAPEPQEDTGPSSYELLPARRTGANGAIEEGYIHHDKRSGETEFKTGTTLTGRPGAGGGRSSVFEQKQAAWMAVHPGDAQGALDYASGRRSLGDAEIAKAALAMAQREVTSNFQARFGKPGDQQGAIDKRAKEIAQALRTGFGGAPAAPGSKPAAQAPSMMTPGDGGKPVNIQLPPRPPGVPPEAGYSPGTRRYYTPDGRVFDENGQPVAR